MKSISRSLLIIIAILLVLTCCVSVGTVFAEEGNGDREVVASGTCGADLTWELDDEGTLTISGTGDMNSYSSSFGIPWYSFRKSINTAVINEGATSIGNYAFSFCSSLTSIVIPESVTSIGSDAFRGCTSLITITIPGGVTSIGSYAFQNCSSLISIAIPDGVTDIEPYTFSGCSSLTSITIPETVTSIGSYAFQNCSSLTSIDIPEGITDIEPYTFSGCSSLTSITIPETVTSIGSYAFQNCSSLTSIAIPEGIADIKTYTFSGCSSLTNITIPETVTSIGSCAFQGCSSITSITLPFVGESVRATGDNCKFSYVFGTIPDSLSDVTITGGSISGNNAFSDCSNLTSVTITGTVKSVGGAAFRDCSSLTSVAIHEGVTSIGDDAFHNCSSLSSITMPEGLTRIGSNAFWNCKSLTDIVIPEGVTSIENGVFRDCSKLKSITIPSSLTSIWTDTFSGCFLMRAVYIHDLSKYLSISFGAGNNISSGCPTIHGGSLYLDGELVTNLVIPEDITSINSCALYNCHSIKSITVHGGVTSIGKSAFHGCSDLESITLPFVGATDGATGNEGKFSYLFDTVPSSLRTVTITGGSIICSSAFSGCSNLESITLPFVGATEEATGDEGKFSYVFGTVPDSLRTVIITGGSSICDYAFSDCSNLTNITIPQIVTSIGSYAFQNCSSLTSFVIPDGVASIETCTFSGCSSLTNITIPETVTSIGGHAFQDCNSLTNIAIPETVTSIGSYAFQNCSSLASIAIPEGITDIKTYTFSGCSSLTNITIPETVTSIGSYAFQNCSSLTSIAIPEGIADIKTYTFSGCSSLTNITIPETVTSIGSYAFQNCSSLISIAIPDGVTDIEPYTFSGCSSLTSITIPETVTSIGSYAFQNCSSLTSIDIPEGITDIEPYTFSGCSSLTSITIPETVTSIGSYAFQNCSSLTSIAIPEGITYIEPYTFSGCSSLTNLTIPETVTSIDGSAFSGCSGLTSITLPFVGAFDGATSDKGKFAYVFGTVPSSLKIVNITGGSSIASYAFSNCGNLTSIVIPQSITSIGNSAFYNCGSLTSMVIPEGVTGIEPYTFSGCSSLTNITIPETVTSMGNYAFQDCGHLANIEIPEGVTNIGSYAFFNCYSLTDLTIPDGLENIGQCAFSGCLHLNKVYISDLSRYLRMSFGDASSCPTYNGASLYINEKLATEILIPKEVGVIKKYAFYGCTQLTNVIIPEGITSIGKNAFYNCTDLTSVTIPASVTSIGNSVFSQKNPYVIVYTIPGAYVVSHKPSYCTINYLCEPYSDIYFGFTTDTIVMKAGGQFTLSKFFKTNYVPTQAAWEWEFEDGIQHFYYTDDTVTSISAGEGTMMVTMDSYSARVKIIALDEDPAEIETLSLNKSGLNLNIGDKVLATVTVSPSYANSSDISWSSSDESVVTVEDGLITAIGEGTATVTVFSSANPNVRDECKVTVTGALYDLIPLENPIKVDLGDSHQVLYYTYPYVESTVVTFSSEDPDIVEIDEHGVVTAKSRGITSVSINTGSISKQIKVIVPLELQGISLDKTSATIYKGESLQLNVTFEPEYAMETDIEWSSSDESVATVDQFGLVTAHGRGIAVITARGGEFTATCEIECPRVPLEEIQLPRFAQVVIGYSTDLELTYIPDSTTDDLQATWTSSNESVATVTDDGVVTACGSGTATVTATVGTCTASTVVIVYGDDLIGGFCGDEVQWVLTDEGTLLIFGTGPMYDYYKSGTTHSYKPPYYDDYRSLIKSIVIEEGVTTIGDYAFIGCDNVTSISIPEDLTSIGEHAFDYCSSLLNITVPESVTIIRDYAFSRCSSLTSITIPEGVTSIREFAFYGCSSLTSITIPDGLTSIEGGVFWDCSSLTSITIPEGVTSIGGSAFRNCSGLTNIDIPDGVTRVGYYAFCDCTGLTSIVIPDGVTSIEFGVFQRCANLSSIVIPQGVTSIEYDAFNGCSSLTKMVVPENVTSIEHRAFSDCTNLSSIFMSEKVTSFGEEVLNNCTNLTTIYVVQDSAADYWVKSLGYNSKIKYVYKYGEHYVYDEIIKEANCVESGSKTHTCVVCDEIITEDIPALGHAWSDWVLITAPGCETNGEEKRVCANDNSHVETRVIPALGHDWDEGTVIKEPTYFAEGLILYTCRRDPSHTYTAVIPKLDRPDESIILRLAGSNRSETAIEAAKHLKARKGIEKFDNIIIASGTGFADALSASYLAYKKDGPILLVDRSSILTVSNFVNENLAPGGKVFIIGGEGAVSMDVDSYIIAGSGNDTVVRLAGKDRFTTNIMVLNEAGVEGEDLLVASGSGFADALSASAAKKPILLVGKSLSDNQTIYLNSHVTSLSGKYYVIGGPGAVAQDIENALTQYGTVKRLQGNDRFATSIAVAEEFFPGNVDTVVVAFGTNFPDGLSGGPIAAAYDAPLILVTDKVYAHAVTQFAQKNAFQLVVMGGTGVISDATAEKIAYNVQ